MKYTLQYLIDMEHFQNLQDRLNEIYSFPSAIIDNEGNILTATAWQDICTQFHRKNKDCEKFCIQSDKYILSHLHEANPAVSYRCPHGLVDNATPIIIDGIHYGNFFTGQFFLEKPDLEFFRAQARKYGFEEEAYLEAVKKVPIWTREQLNSYLYFIKGLISIISESGLKKLKEIETRKQIEETEERADTILHQMQDGFWITSPINGQVVDANEAMCRMLGYTRDELLTMSVADVEAIDSHEMIAQRIQQIIQTGSARFESRFRRKNGAIFDVEVGITYLPKRNLIFGFHRDITERKRAAEALRESGELLRGVIDNSSAVIYIKDRDGKYLLINQLYQNLFHISNNEIHGKSDHEIFPPEKADTLRDNDLRVLNEEKTFEFEEIVPHDDGIHTYISLKFPLRDARGEINAVCGISTDITDRKRAEAALRESEELYRNLAEDMPVYVTMSLPDGTLTYVNTATAMISGMRPDEMVGHNFLDTLNPEDRIVTMERLGALTPDNPTETFEQTFMALDGSQRYQQWINRALFDENGRAKVFQAIGQDITERKRAEDALREVNDLLSLFIKHSPIHAYIKEVTPTESRVLQASENYQNMIGIPGSKMIGMNMGDMFPAEFAEKITADDWAVVSCGKVLKLDEDLNGRNYTSIKFPISLGDKNLLAGYTIDITERKQAEEELRKSEVRFRSYFDLPLHGIAITSPEKGWIEVNGRVCSILGYTRDEILRMTWSEITHPDDLAADTELFERMISGKIDQYQMEKRFIRKDGIVIWTTLSVGCVRESDGKMNYAIALLDDITQRKQAEEVREKLEAQLLQSQKMEAVGRLAGGVAHDFNNMLGIILGHAELALGSIDPSDPLHADLVEIQKAGKRSADLTRQLLAFARKQTVAPKVLELNETVEGMLKMLHRLIGEDIDLSWNPDTGLWQVKIDPSQIDQILANMCVNARDAIEDVGKVTIETANVVFDDIYCTEHEDVAPGEYVMLAVSDDGCGMDRETVSKLFEPFFTTKEAGKGTGLGLSMVYGIVKQNSGFINVYSEPGEGTTFKIYLPRFLGKTAHAALKGPSEEATGGPETILLVEDEPAILKLGKNILERFGYTVLAANTPGEAIRLAHEYAGQIHLLMTDVVMPEMNGRDLAKHLLSLYPNIRRLFMSGYTANVIAHHGVLDEGVHFIQKPFTLKDLAAKVREALEQK